MMNMERDFYMSKGEGESSYSKNSRRPVIVIAETMPVIEKSVKEVYTALLPQTMVVADLGCSSGPNALIFVSNVINAIADHSSKLGGQGDHVEVQFFLNDLPGNDFNQLFRSLEQFKRSAEMDRNGDTLPPYYVSGLPDSYYVRLFPRQSVHLFHSSYCLHWRSQVPEGLEGKREVYLNGENMYIAKNTPPSVVKLFQEQFRKDFSLFLRLRHEELAFGGQVVLTFLGRKDEDVYSGDLNHLFGLLSQSLQSLVVEGLVKEEKVSSFNLPAYGPSVGEVMASVKESGAFDIAHIKLFEQNWDPYDDSEGDGVLDSARSSVNAAKCIRSVMESLVASHFGEDILDALFEEYTCRVAGHLEKEKTKFTVVVLALKKI
ncbi:unnamed protein product [Triticum turgidum subsp. durum]|uniref:Uncharacterized protein n=1 Tax=Triticum turgidum subsp. durum TaxID=4567 RepID=A0A9R0ZV95_TRITD|nr:unnamed protein product [Triticum turgidum subsp. durum]